MESGFDNMTIPARKIFRAVLLLAMILISSPVSAQGPLSGNQTPSADQKAPAGPPDLADIIPLATELFGRLETLEIFFAGSLDLSAVEKKYSGIQESLKNPSDHLLQLKNTDAYNYNRLVELKNDLEKRDEKFQEIGKPLTKAIRQLGVWRKEWLAEKKRWDAWGVSLLEEGRLRQLGSTFFKANNTIDTALNLILVQLDAMLRVQQRAGEVQAKIQSLSAELDGLIADKRRDGLINASPLMFSGRYFSQFGSSLWYALQKSLDVVSWPAPRFFAEQGGILLIQFFMTLFIIVTVYRNRPALHELERWRFLAARPFSAGLFFAGITAMVICEYEGAPASLKLANTLIAGISFSRLSGSLMGQSWKKQFVYGLVVILIVTNLLDLLRFPLPLFRLYTVLAALSGLVFCLRWSGESKRSEDPALYQRLLRLGALFFGVIFIAEIWGKDPLPLFLLLSLVSSTATALVFALFSHMVRGGFEWAFRTLPFRRAARLDRVDGDAIIRRVALLIDGAIWGLIVLPTILVIWGVYDRMNDAANGLLALGFSLGSLRISLGLIVASAGIFYGSLLVSGFIQKSIMDEALDRRRVETGVKHAIARLVHYVIICASFLFILSIFGFEITKLTIMLSAFGVGIGFGLQGIVNNFVSGLILLFERPVRVGDTIDLGGKYALITKIGLRATTVQTYDQADVIIPNADLISNQVTNWTLSSRRVRLTIPVGVAYGSDVPLVMERLMAGAKTNSMVVKVPEPQVLFLSFGESSLDFELRVWVSDVSILLQAKSELHQEIDRSFREAKIEISFPQRDLHLRSLDDSIILRPSANGNYRSSE